MKSDTCGSVTSVTRPPSPECVLHVDPPLKQHSRSAIRANRGRQAAGAGSARASVLSATGAVKPRRYAPTRFAGFGLDRACGRAVKRCRSTARQRRARVQSRTIESEWTMKTNVTLKRDSELLREAKVLAVEEGRSTSALLTEQLEALVRERKEYDHARRRTSRTMRRLQARNCRVRVQHRDGPTFQTTQWQEVGIHGQKV
jgi:hypothetical protein